MSQRGLTGPSPANSLILWAPGQHQCYGHPQQPHTHSWIHCDGRCLRETIADLNLPLDRVIAPADGLLFKGMLAAVYDELTTQAEPDEVIVGNHIENWMRALARQIRQRNKPDWTPRTLLDLKHHLDVNFSRPHRLAGMALRLNMSVPHLCSLFRRHFGISPIHYVIRSRLRHALYLLSDRNLSIQEISRRVGYDDLFHFSKLFKKYHGLAPRQMRRRILG